MYQKYATLRDKRGITDYRVAVETGIAKSTLSEWKRGRSTPKADKIKLLADYFNVPMEYFYSDEEKKGA